MSEVECPRCSRAADAAARFCEACGAALPPVCGACGHRGNAGARFCAACGAALRAPPATTATPRGAPRAYTPRHLAEKILTQRAALEGERKQVTVMFVDLKSSMEIAESVDPEEWHRIMDRFFAIVSEGVHRYEGTINQYTGDGAMALFGAPIAHEDHAERACFAALELGRGLARYGDELRREHGIAFAARIGLNSGEVVVGRIGDDLRMDYTAQGHTVGLAARVEQLTDPGRVYVTEHVAALVAGRFRLRDLGAHRIRGVREPVGIFDLEGRGPLRSRLEISRARGFSPFVGRRDESARLDAALERALGGRGGVVAVVGEAGLGKSRLCFELAARARASGVAVCEGHAVPYGRAIPFLPVQELLRSVLGILERDPPAEARRKIAGTLLLVDRTLHDALPMVFDFLGVADPREAAPRVSDPDAVQRRLFAILQRVIRERAAHEPQLLVVEDLHWLDAGSEAFLRALAGMLSDVRALLLVNFRPEYASDWTSERRCERVTLAPLEPEASAELLAELLGRDPSLCDLAARIAERTAGNPFFIEETVRALADAGHVAGTRGAYRLAEGFPAPVLPATVQAVLAARIDRLPENEKALLQTAAVIGKRFARSVLERIADVPQTGVGSALAELERLGFVHEEAREGGETSYVFNHPLTQEVAYRSQLGARRERVHAAVASALEALHEGRTDEIAALLAHHHQHAGDLLAAARWTRRAAERATRSDVGEAARLWQQARALVARLPEDANTVEIAVWAGIQLLNLGWRSGLSDAEAAEIFRSGVALAERIGDQSAVAGFLVTYGAVRGLSGAGQEALELISEAARVVERADSPETAVSIQCALVQSQLMVGRLRDALATIELALVRTARSPGLGNDRTGFDTHSWLLMSRGGIRVETGDLRGAAADLEQSIERARSLHENEILGWSLEMRAKLAHWSLDHDGALAYARQAVQIAERLGSAFSQASAWGRLGYALLARGQPGEAADALQHAIEVIRTRRTFLHWEAGSLAQLAEVYAAQGRHDEAQATARDAVELAVRRGTAFIEVIALLSRARVLLAAGRVDYGEVGALLDRASDGIRRTGAESWAPLVEVERARLARLRGDEPAWRSALERAGTGFAAIGADELAREVAAELAAGT
ncbi:MAG: AAA family ATPase [Thermodesulfobacteriota bacterium]